MGIAATALALGACGDAGQTGNGRADVVVREPQPLGRACWSDDECISRICMESQYGTPFCTRPCSTPWEPCAGGDDAAAGSALCVSFDDLPNTGAPAFEGDMSQFCVPRCSDVDECTADEPAWEACEVPQWLGDPLYPALGNVRVCQSPSFHGKDPVDPALCDWERTVKAQFSNQANLCRSYCEYLDRCKVLAVDEEGHAETTCCEWGCYNRMVIEDVVQDAWYDEVKCYLEFHAAFPPEGPRNACTEPPKNCGGDPDDPTPPASRH
ncbi:MAG: hypothetical protein IT385_21010 [Deltaproteobacteria bacterium]|nr:hypothetical protein [Deltaproteobacteria bacterium]